MRFKIRGHKNIGNIMNKMYFHLTQSGRERSMKKFEVEGGTEPEKEIDLWHSYEELQRERENKISPQTQQHNYECKV